MRAALLRVAALCAPVVFAVPHGGNHRHQHPARGHREAETVTDIVTVTANNAVVWVDQFNNVLSTVYHGQTTPTSVASSSDDTPVIPPTAFAAAFAPKAQPPGETPGTPAAASPSPSTADPSLYIAPSDPAPAPPAPAPTSAEAPMASDDSARIANKGTQSGNGANTGNVGHSDNTGNTGQSDNSRNVGSSSGSSTGAGGFGIDYELIGSNGCKSQSEMNSEFGFLSGQGYSKIRFYDIGCDLSVATAAAAAAGMSVTLGLNTINNLSGDLGTLTGMIKGNWGPVDTVVIGNEVVNQGGDPNAVAGAVNTARGILQTAGFTKNVVTVDTYIAHQNNPQLCAASDYCAVNCHAFFDANTEASQAGTFVKTAISKIQNNGKAIIVTESGWPYQGSANGAAVPSVANQQTAIASLKSAFGGNPGGLFLFQAYDASYKPPGQFGVEPFFGIYGH